MNLFEAIADLAKRKTWPVLFTFLGLGVIFLGGFQWALAVTNTEQFCISCHEMEENVFKEYRDTIHYANRTGVRATCPDCHVPRQWQHMVVRKIQASNELLHKVLGTIDTPEKFERKRLELARHVWEAMKKTDSRECRNCHNFNSMDFTRQGIRAFDFHERGFAQNKTCIDCHKGIAHTLPRGMTVADDSSHMQ
ncbi:NapC/NirT family cytochrome c [Candidatus Magnetaquicoccus inordinatus]|uniref:NapC/NirT family cytochrome c n=1 Tax=Candidatus Magnetaquicoccus inordinatus TaxID=2496818 RepID=UPI00102B168C|nr:NapC/NirT family cytochrome c [Candidatus Magnetaquicoccus inordinatus]